MVGQSIAHYKITEKIGEGGMGEVYRATDTKLNRDVALKVLLEAFAEDEQRMARFSREAQVLASLSHPNIGAIFGLEEEAGKKALVLELIEGETLAERIAKGPVPLENALGIALQMTEALEAAHEKGIIHRDLKPANVKITPEGQVKVLDFGLAKALERDRAGGDSTDSPTLSMAATRDGYILGTAAYMAPEQARGKPIDRRADIWAFGAVLYEMLTARTPFPGEDVTEILASVVKSDPEWRTLPDATPPQLRMLLRRCLRKDPIRRLRDIGDARLELSELDLPQPSAEAVGPAGLSATWSTVGVLAIGLAILLGALWAPFSKEQEAGSAPRLDATLELLKSVGSLHSKSEGSDTPFLALSQNGSQLVYQADTEPPQLVLRRLADAEERLLPGTEGASYAFFSPDGQQVGFFQDGKLMKVAVTGGAAVELADAPNPWGGTWGEGGTIVFTPVGSGTLWRVSADGGDAHSFTTLDAKNGEQEHSFPHALPGGKEVLFSTFTGGGYGNGRIQVINLETGAIKPLIEGGGNPSFAPSGHLVFARNGQLLAAPFDLDTLEVTGSPSVVLDGLFTHARYQIPVYALSHSGTLVFAEGGVQKLDMNLVWVTREGSTETIPQEAAAFDFPVLSPEGRRIIYATTGSDNNIEVYDLRRGIKMPVTTGDIFAETPWWSPDGKSAVFSYSPEGRQNIYIKDLESSQPARPLLALSDNPRWSPIWSPDGQWIAFTEIAPTTRADIWMFSLEKQEASPFVSSPAYEDRARFSPDNKWVAFISDESGRNEVYVSAFSEPNRRIRISREGGNLPVWSRDGRRLFFTAGDRVMGVDVHFGSELDAGIPKELFKADNLDLHGISLDGRRFLGVRWPERPPISTVRIVLNWHQALKGEPGS